jgi:hypothetical protein
MELNFFFIKFTNGVLTIVDVGRDVTRNNVLQIKEFYGELTQVANNLEKQRNKKKRRRNKESLDLPESGSHELVLWL